MKVESLEEDNATLARKAEQSSKAIEQIQQEYGTDANLLDVPEGNLVFKAISMLPTQQKAPFVEKFVGKALDWGTMHSSKGRGDFYDSGKDKYIELKTSFTNKGRMLNARQIRPWQDVDEYMCFYIDEINPSSSVLFVLDKNAMLDEIEKHGSHSHGTKESNLLNIHKEISLTVPINPRSDMYNRWLASYSKPVLLKHIMEGDNGKN